MPTRWIATWWWRSTTMMSPGRYVAGVWTNEVVPFRRRRAAAGGAARNLGAQTAIDGGAELLIFLDVDCIPAPNMVGTYRRAAEHPDHAMRSSAGR